MGQGDNQIGDGGPDIGSHNHGNGVFETQDTRADQADYNRGGGRGGLDNGRGQNTYHQAYQGIGCRPENGNREILAEQLEGGTKQGNGQNKKIEQGEY